MKRQISSLHAHHCFDSKVFNDLLFYFRKPLEIILTSVYIRCILLCLIILSSCQKIELNNPPEQNVSHINKNLLTLVSGDCELGKNYPNPMDCRLYDASQYITGSTTKYVQGEIWGSLKNQPDISNLKDYLSKKGFKVTSIDSISNTFSIQTGILSEKVLFDEMRLLGEISSVQATFLNQPITLF